MKKNKILSTLMLTILALILLTSTTNAAYQSIPKGAGRDDTATAWITGVRQMEESNGGMGLNETIDTKTGLATTASNGIDVHLQKNTEYGAVILLGASDYGKQGQNDTSGASRYMNYGATSTSGTATNLATSTGNVTGVYELGYSNMTTARNYWEWTAGGGKTYLSNIATRYRDIYETSGVGKAGDATIENGIKLGTAWHNSSGANFATGGNGFKRGNYGAFSYDYNGASNSYRARAVVVSAAGL